MPTFQITRSKTVAAPLQTIGDLEEVVGLLLAPIFPPRRGIRLLAFRCHRWNGRRYKRNRSCGWRFRLPASAEQERLNGA